MGIFVWFRVCQQSKVRSPSWSSLVQLALLAPGPAPWIHNILSLIDFEIKNASAYLKQGLFLSYLGSPGYRGKHCILHRHPRKQPETAIL